MAGYRLGQFWARREDTEKSLLSSSRQHEVQAGDLRDGVVLLFVCRSVRLSPETLRGGRGLRIDPSTLVGRAQGRNFFQILEMFRMLIGQYLRRQNLTELHLPVYQFIIIKRLTLR